MIVCPKCGKPVSGRARTCGYCGASLVNDYFSRGEEPTIPVEQGAGAVAALLLGVFGGVALLGALVLQLAVLFGFGSETLMPTPNFSWWIRTLLMAILPAIFLVQQFVLRTVRFSMVPDCIWLFLSACGLFITAQATLEFGASAFYGVLYIPYLLTVGCALAVVSCTTGILSYNAPV